MIRRRPPAIKGAGDLLINIFAMALARCWRFSLLWRVGRYFFLSGGSLFFGGGSGSIGGVDFRLLFSGPLLYRLANAIYFMIVKILLFCYRCLISIYISGNIATIRSYVYNIYGYVIIAPNTICYLQRQEVLGALSLSTRYEWFDFLFLAGSSLR